MIEETNDLGHTTIWYTVSEVAKMLNLKDGDNKPIGRNKFFRVLRYNKVLMYHANQPYQYFVQLGLLKLHSSSKNWKQYYIPVFSERGVNYLKNKL